jgi:CRISP-associated protein Cas1
MHNHKENSFKQIFTIIAKPSTKSSLIAANNNLVFRSDKIIVCKIPLSKILFVILAGRMTISTQLLFELSAFGIRIVLTKHNFAQQFEMSPLNTHINKKLKISQIELINNPPKRLQIAKHIIKNKIYNQIKYISKPKDFLKLINVDSAQSNNQLMGIEGSVSAKYFGIIFSKHNWISRKPRQKHDITNFILDIGYTYLFGFVSTICTQIGFENSFGFLHEDYYQRQSFVCDIMEPMRPIIDFALVKAYNLGQIHKNHFELDNGKIRIIDYKTSGQYTDIFVKIIIDHQDRIYEYINEFAIKLQNDPSNLPNFVL